MDKLLYKSDIQLCAEQVFIREIVLHPREIDFRYDESKVGGFFTSLNGFILNTEMKSELYDFGYDACGHSEKERINHLKITHPYFLINATQDTGHHTHFTISHNDYSLEDLNNFLNNSLLPFSTPFRYILDNSLSMLEIFFVLAMLYPESIKSVDYFIDSDSSRENYMSAMKIEANKKFLSRRFEFAFKHRNQIEEYLKKET